MDGRVVNVQELQLEEEEGAVCRVGDAPRVLAVIAVAQICTAASQCMSCSWVWALYSLPPTFPPSPPSRTHCIADILPDVTPNHVTKVRGHSLSV